MQIKLNLTIYVKGVFAAKYPRLSTFLRINGDIFNNHSIRFLPLWSTYETAQARHMGANFTAADAACIFSVGIIISLFCFIFSRVYTAQ